MTRLVVEGREDQDKAKARAKDRCAKGLWKPRLTAHTPEQVETVLTLHGVVKCLISPMIRLVVEGLFLPQKVLVDVVVKDRTSLMTRLVVEGLEDPTKVMDIDRLKTPACIRPVRPIKPRSIVRRTRISKRPRSLETNIKRLRRSPETSIKPRHRLPRRLPLTWAKTPATSSV